MNVLLLVGIIAVLVLPALAATLGPFRPATASDVRKSAPVLAGLMLASAAFGLFTGYARGRVEVIRPEVERINRTKQSVGNKFLAPDEAKPQIAAEEARIAQKEADVAPVLRIALNQAATFLGIGLLVGAPLLSLFLVRQRLLRMAGQPTV